MGWVTETLTVVSCLLSIAGSAAVAATSKFSLTNNRKAGKTLLFWLSIADLFSAVVYLWPVHPDRTDKYNERLCEAQAVLGIFFPVASFVWTDLVAYYIYTVVVERRTRNQAQWETELRRYHWYAWGIAALCAGLVAATGHAGHDHDLNTGGWCWVKADHTAELVIWELIGGKLVEWISIVVIVPVLYWRAWRELIRLQDAVNRTSESMPMSVRLEPERNCFGCIRLVKKPVPLSVASSVMPSEDSTHLVAGMALSSDIHSPASADAVAGAGAGNADEPQRPALPSRAASSAFHSGPLLSTYRSPSTLRRNIFESGGQATDFRQFFLRLGLLPCVFFLGRFPGNLRMILYMCGATTDASERWLGKLQAFGDPAQGFLNALLFVVFSKEGRSTIATLTALCWSWCTGKPLPPKPQPPSPPQQAVTGTYQPPDDRAMSCSSIKPFSHKPSTAGSMSVPSVGGLEDGVDEEGGAEDYNHSDPDEDPDVIDEIEEGDSPGVGSLDAF